MSDRTNSLIWRTLLYTAIVLAWIDPLVTWATYRYIRGGTATIAIVVICVSFALVLAIAFFVERDLRSRRGK